MKYGGSFLIFFYVLSLLHLSCKDHVRGPSVDLVHQINLKRGDIISCGASGNQFGSVDFDMSCSKSVRNDINLAMELLHSFEYDEAEKAFAKVIDREPECAMAYWGVAMANFHPLWSPPTEAELKKGALAVEIATSISHKTERETGYINAVSAFYDHWEKADHHTRSVRFEQEMEKLHKKYPDDKEAAVFYALALDATASPTDKTYAHQKKAGAILQALYPAEPDHPGIIHYIIHTYDYPGLAIHALPAARKYATVAPSSAHALHMPSHIFTRLGLWDEDIRSNLLSVEAAKCYATAAGIKGHWDEELHGLDYLVYAYLQKGNNHAAKDQVNYLKTFTVVSPVNFKVAYAFAAIPSRYVLENKNWEDAASLQHYPENFQWDQFPWQEAIIYFTRAIGLVHTAKISEASSELVKLQQLHDKLEKAKDVYSARQVDIQVRTVEAWIRFMSGEKDKGLQLMKGAADKEDSTEKHPVTPGEILPARELLGDMLFQMQHYEEALHEYEAALIRSPNRFNSLYGAGVAAEKSGHTSKADYYYKQLKAITDPASDRPELSAARLYLKSNQ